MKSSTLIRTALSAAALVLASPAADAFAAAGGLDLGFGQGGTAVSGIVGDDLAHAVAVQPDRKVVVAGQTASASGDVKVLVERLNPDGSPDRSFDGDGRVTIGTPAAGEVARAVVVQRDGKIVVAGSTTAGVGGLEDVVVYRLRQDGSPDPSFDVDGAAGINSGGYEAAKALAIQPDGRILVAGSTTAGAGGTDDAVLYRLKPNGGTANTVNDGLDPSFDVDGAAGVDSGYTQERANAIALQPDGEIVVAGVVGIGPGANAAVYRFKPNGGTANTVNDGLDPSFDVDGAAGLDSGRAELANAIALQPDGKIVVAGQTSAGVGGIQDAIVYRLKPNGGTANTLNDALDPSFDVDGAAGVDSGAAELATALVLQPDGKIVIAGQSRVSGSIRAAAIYRLRRDGGTTNTVNGALDPSFGSGGATLIRSGYATATALALLPDRKLVVAGFTSPGGDVRDMTVYRLFGDPFGLTVEKSGAGTIASAPGGIDCGLVCARPFDVGTRLTLTATASPGARFTGWSGGGCSGTRECRLELAGDTTVKASFVPGSIAPVAFGKRTLVTLRLAKRQIRSRGPVKVVVKNANGFSVRGRLAVKASRVKLRPKALTLAGNGKQTLRLKLPKKLRRLLERKGKLRLRATATVTDPAGNTRTVNRRLSPRLKRGNRR